MRKEELIEKIIWTCDCCKKEMENQFFTSDIWFHFTDSPRGADYTIDLCEDCAKKLVEELKTRGIEGEYR